MVGTQPAQHSSTAAAMIFGSATTTPVGAGGSAPPPAQVLSDLFDALAMLLAAEVDAANWDQHNTEIAKLKDQITQAKEDLAAEETRMAEERAALETQAQRIQAENYRLLLD